LYQNNPAFGFGPTQIMGLGFETNKSTNSHSLFGSKPNNIGFQMTTSAFGANNTFEDTSTAQSGTDSLFDSKSFNKAPTTSLFNQTIDHSSSL